MHQPPAAHLSPPHRGNWTGQAVLLAALLAIGGWPLAPVRAISLQFDYTYDTLGFFGTAANPTPARAALEFAGRTFTAFADTLAPIEPGGGNLWTAQFVDPATGSTVNIPNLHVPQDTVIVYALARDLQGFALGQSRPGAYSFSGAPSLAFADAVVNRGQGSSSVDFAPWGGAIAVDTHHFTGAPRQWHYDLDVAPSLGEYDFHTVVVHELAHLFGFGASLAFTADVVNNEFTGAAVQELYRQPAPLSGGEHWAANVTSPPFLPGTQPKPSLGPTLSLGERKPFTPLDYAALADIGWQVPPELLGLPADFDGDADVDGADFLTWQRGFGGFGGTPGDANGDLRVDQYDGWIVRQYFGSVGQKVGEPFAAVPEPYAPSLSLTAAAALAAAKRRLPSSTRRRHR